MEELLAARNALQRAETALEEARAHVQRAAAFSRPRQTGKANIARVNEHAEYALLDTQAAIKELSW